MLTPIEASESDVHSKLCAVCGGKIKIQIFKGTQVCCENCRAIKNGDFKKSGRN